MPRKRISINLAPADISKDSNGLEVTIATAALAVIKQIQRDLAASQAVTSELGLDSTIRPVRGIIGKLLSGRKRGIHTFFMPAASLEQAKVVSRVRFIPFETSRSCIYISIKHSGSTL